MKIRMATAFCLNVSANAIIDFTSGATADVKDNVCIAEDVNVGALMFRWPMISEDIANGQAGDELD